MFIIMEAVFDANFVSLCGRKSIETYDLNTKKSLHSFKNTSKRTFKLQITEENEHFYLNSLDNKGYFNRFDIQADRSVAFFKAIQGEALEFKVIDGLAYFLVQPNNLVITDLEGNTVKNLALEKGKQISSVSSLAAINGNICFSSGKSVFTLTQESKISLLGSLDSEIRLVRFLEEGKLLLTATSDGLMQVWYFKKMKDGPLVTLRSTLAPVKVDSIKVDKNTYHIAVREGEKVEIYNMELDKVDVNKPNNPDLTLVVGDCLDFRLEGGNGKGIVHLLRNEVSPFKVSSIAYFENKKVLSRKIVMGKKENKPKITDFEEEVEEKKELNVGSLPIFKASSNKITNPNFVKALKSGQLEEMLINTEIEVENLVSSLKKTDLTVLEKELKKIIEKGWVNQFLLLDLVNLLENQGVTGLKELLKGKLSPINELLALEGKLSNLENLAEQGILNENEDLRLSSQNTLLNKKRLPSPTPSIEESD